MNIIDPLGLESQISINIIGSLAGSPFPPFIGLGLGASGGLGVGISIGDSFWDTQIFISPRAAGMVTAGLYAGIGLTLEGSESEGPLPLLKITNSVHIEANGGWGISAGASVDIIPNSCDKATSWFKKASKLSSISAGGGKIGGGFGGMFGVGVQTSTTIVIPTFGAIRDWIQGLF